MNPNVKMDRRQLLREFTGLSRSFLPVAIGLSLLPQEGNCQSDERSEFFEVAGPIFSGARSIRSFSLPDRLYAAAADLTLETLGPLPISKEVSASFREFLVSKLTEQSSYLFGVRKAMRFYADRGLIFEGLGNKNVFLISTDFRGGRLVLDRPLNPRVFIVNLDPIFPGLLERLNQSLQ